MAELSDERVRFYLRHRDQIETWAALRSEAAAAIDTELERIRDDIESLAADLGDDVLLLTKIEGEAYPRFLLHRESWKQNANDPVVSIALEWMRGKTFLNGNASAYVGIRVTVKDQATRKLRTSIKDATQTQRSERGDRVGQWWPCLRYCPCVEPFWDDFETYRRQLLGELRHAWEAYDAPLESVVQSAEPPGE